MDLSSFSSLRDITITDGIILSLPPSLHTLTFMDDKADLPLSFSSFPPTLSSLKFGWYYNCSISSLSFPSSLTRLSFGWWFDQPVDNLPSSLTFLSFGCHFNQPLNIHLPHLTRLRVHEGFNHSINPLNFPSLKYLTVGESYKLPIEFVGVEVSYPNPYF